MDMTQLEDHGKIKHGRPLESAPFRMEVCNGNINELNAGFSSKACFWGPQIIPNHPFQ
jgi:hypothetical protein